MKNLAPSHEMDRRSHPEAGHQESNVPFGLVKFRVRVKGSPLSAHQTVLTQAGLFLSGKVNLPASG